MSEKKKAMVPVLRFPGFREAGEWEEKTLDDVAVFFKGKGISKSDIDSQGETPCIRYGELYTIYGEVISTVFSKTILPTSELFLSQKCDVLIPSSGETKIDIAKASCVMLDDVALGGDLNVLRPNENGIFLSYMLNGVCKREIAKKAQGDTVVHLYSSQLKLLDVLVPKEPEQQKIADCLSSLDELITLEAQKLATLKTHKKGLMQGLFPSIGGVDSEAGRGGDYADDDRPTPTGHPSNGGEFVPKLRFPEFRGKGEWEPKSIGQLGEVVTGSTPSTAQAEYYGGERLFVSPADISDDRFIEKTKTTLTEPGFRETRPIKVNSILFVCIGSTIGKIAQNRQECATNQQINSVIPNSENSDGFVYYALSGIADKIANLAGKQAVPIVNKTLFSSVELSVPKLPEQNRIAICLSSLDELILAQSQKLAALKTHKKGLMQQLFPAMDAHAEVEA